MCSCGSCLGRVQRREDIGQCQRTVCILQDHRWLPCECFLYCSSRELLSFLKGLKNSSEVRQNIVDIRGQGLMVAVEFASPLYPSSDPAANHAPKGLASRVAKRCMEKGMLILTTSVHEVIRFIPPLNISQEDLEKGCGVFAEAVREVVQEG